MTRTENAVKNFQEGYACSQAVLTAYCEHFNLSEKAALRLSTGFGGGMDQGKTCGAVTGAYMVIGLAFAGENCQTSTGRTSTYREIAGFSEKFKARHGSCDCESLLGCNIGTSQGLQKAKDEQLFQTICPNFVRSAALLLEEMLTT